MIRHLWFAVLLSACAADSDVRDPDVRNIDQGIAVSQCSYCHSSITTPLNDGWFTRPHASIPHTACTADAACAAAHADAPEAKLSNALEKPCETCHAAVTP